MENLSAQLEDAPLFCHIDVAPVCNTVSIQQSLVGEIEP
jgi:hypothetical protein